MKHIPRKRFGQHFLTDGGIIAAIVEAIGPKPGQHMVEIGPGLAALTQPLVERLGALTVIELDRDLAQRMLQKEVIDRMVARPATSDYSRLSVMLQWRYAMENVLRVPPESFEPPPRVNSAVVRMLPLQTPPELDVKRLSEIVQVAFSQRRKLLRHTLGKWLQEKSFAGNFDVQRRAEEVPVAEYVALAQST